MGRCPSASSARSSRWARECARVFDTYCMLRARHARPLLPGPEVQTWHSCPACTRARGGSRPARQQRSPVRAHRRRPSLRPQALRHPGARHHPLVLPLCSPALQAVAAGGMRGGYGLRPALPPPRPFLNRPSLSPNHPALPACPPPPPLAYPSPTPFHGRRARELFPALTARGPPPAKRR
jgi:hypothetical protein